MKNSVENIKKQCYSYIKKMMDKIIQHKNKDEAIYP